MHREQVQLTWALIERAERIRRGEEVLYVPTADDSRYNTLVGDRRRTWSVGRKPHIQVFIDNPEMDCGEDCQECRAEGLY